MTMSNMEFDIGDKIVVKDGVLDPDFGTSIEGWTGKISEVDENADPQIICRIEWDDMTLKEMSKHHIDTCDRDNLDHTCMYLSGNEIELQPEDSNEEKRKFLELLNKWICRDN